MSRTQRLLELMQLLRRRRRPVSGVALAEELGISPRTLYRDIATLQAQGARIDGEAGVGYLLQPGFTLPPLMFSENEIEAISLGAKWVVESADKELSDAARDVLAKIADVIPEQLRRRLYASPLLVGPVEMGDAEKKRLRTIREAINSGRKLAIEYHDLKERKSVRTLWPFGLGFFEGSRILMAWCEKRSAFRHFRIDRIVCLHELGERYPKDREALLADWRREMAISEDT